MTRLPFLLFALLVSLSASAQMRPLLGGGGAGSGPIPNSAAAAKATAEQNATCTAVSPFYAAITTIATGTAWTDAVNTTQAAWSSVTAYVVGNRVSLSGSNYLALLGSTNVTPPNATYWKPLTTIGSGTGIPMASASKIQYAVYFAIEKGGYSAFTAADQIALNFTDGYANMGSETTGAQCATTGVTYCPAQPTPVVNSINNCLAICGTVNSSQPGSYQNPSAIGQFDYDSGHEQNHASANQTLLGIANLATTALYPKYVTAFGAGGGEFSEPLLAGGIAQSPANSMAFLGAFVGSTTARSILPDATGVQTNSVVPAFCIAGAAVGPTHCPSASNSVYYSPITSKWDYGVGYWWEVDTRGTANNDFSVSSPGAYGTYPFIMPTCPNAISPGVGHPGNVCTTLAEFNAAGANPWTYYGILAASVPSGSGGPTGNGQASGACMALIRYAYATGQPLLTQTIPP